MKNTLFISALILFISIHVTAQSVGLPFIEKADSFFKEYVVDGKVKYDALIDSEALKSLVSDIATADLDGVSDNMVQAFYINAYNILVIDKVVKNYPIGSVQNIGGFFDKKKSTLAGEKISLNTIEKDLLLKQYDDPRFHFALVCGAVGCPPITNFAYHPDRLDSQLDKQTSSAINSDSFLKVVGNKIETSQIFNWYKKDFGGSKKSIIAFINNYRQEPVSDSHKIIYGEYDWLLNEYVADDYSDLIYTPASGANNTLRYVVSSTIPKGSTETKVFNNLYTQKTGPSDNLSDRSTFFTTIITSLYGVSNNLNVGINTRYRRVRNDKLPSSALSVLGGSGGALSTRSGVTAFGPMIRYAPVPEWKNFSIQSSFVFAIGDDLSGSASQPYIDWDGPTWWTQFFNDFSIGNSFSLFTEIDLLIEDIGRLDSHVNRLSTPVTLIFSYNPIANMTLYTLGGYSPYWQADYDYFTQFGIGFKYQFTPNLEFELLYTDFSNEFLNDTGGQASTYNLGFRFNI